MLLDATRFISLRSLHLVSGYLDLRMAWKQNDTLWLLSNLSSGAKGSCCWDWVSQAVAYGISVHLQFLWCSLPCPCLKNSNFGCSTSSEIPWETWFTSFSSQCGLSQSFLPSLNVCRVMWSSFSTGRKLVKNRRLLPLPKFCLWQTASLLFLSFGSFLLTSPQIAWWQEFTLFHF